MSSNLFAKRLIGRMARPFPNRTPRRVILLYHAVGTGPWALPIEVFRAQMEWLAAHAMLRRTSSIEAPAEDGPLEVAITFDDGYGSVVDLALPILEKVRAAPSIYLNTNWIQARDRRHADPAQGHYPGETFLNWQDVRALAERGWTIGSHGMEHLDLTTQPDEVVREELSGSKRILEQTLGAPVEEFAYTWGRSTPRVRRLTAEAGYKRAMGGRHAPVDIASDPMEIPRLNVAKEYSLADFQAIVRGDWDYLGSWQSVKAAWAG
jgi:peptidoglycan/xylan/chitin deacetylase (PgdA/CDA1 family)